MNRRISVRLGVVLLAFCMATMTITPTASADHEYDQPVWFNWDNDLNSTTVLDVHVLEVPQEPVIGTLMQDAIQAWEEGMNELDPNGLGENVVLRVDWIGDIPSQAVADIYFVPEGFYAINLGFPDACVANAPMPWWGGPIEPYGMKAYRTAAHEFGHCLGLDHVFEHGVEYEPSKDLMGSGSAFACPSNLNIQVLQKVFNGESGTVTMDSSNYTQADCSRPSSVFV